MIREPVDLAGAGSGVGFEQEAVLFGSVGLDVVGEGGLGVENFGWWSDGGGLMGIAVLAISTGIGVLAWPASRGHRVALGLFLIPLACETSELGALLLNAMGNL